MMPRICVSLCLAVGCLFSTNRAFAGETPGRTPATVAEAVKALDLAKLPLLEGAKAPGERNAASLSYEAPKATPDAYAFCKDLLTRQGWKEAGEASVMKESASSTFVKDGYVLSFMAYDSGKPGITSLSLRMLGNIDLTALPRPAGTKPFYEGASSAMYLADGTVEDAAKAVRDGLLKAGWEPYGEAGDVCYFKRNAIKLSARVLAAPAQAGKTMIDFSAVLMAADLPAPVDATRVQYSDEPAQLSADAPGTQDDVVAFYKERLGSAGWKPTTPKPFKSGFRNVILFRNPEKEMIRLELGAFEGQTRYLLRKESAEAVAKAEARVDAIRKNVEGRPGAMAGAGRAKKVEPKLTIPLPEGAEKVTLRAHTLRFQVPRGKVLPQIDGYRTTFLKDGWKELTSVLQETAGNLTLKKGGMSLSISYIDTGFLPGEISILAGGAELETSPAR